MVDADCLTRAQETPIASVESGVNNQNEIVDAAAPAPILVAVDMSKHSRAALVWACRYAEYADAPVTVLHILHDPPEAPGTYSNSLVDPLAPMVDTAEKMLAEFMDQARADNPDLTYLTDAETRIVPGLPAQSVVAEAEKLEAALLVVGSRGQTGLPRLLNGSVAQRVAQLSPIPVTFVKAQE